MCKSLWERACGLSSLSETRKSNRLQMLLQRQHFLLSYLKTLSVGPAGVWTHDLPLSRPVLSNWANQAAVEQTRRRLSKPGGGNCHVDNSNNTSSAALWKKELAFTLSSQNKSRREELLTVDTHFLCICNTNYVDFITTLPNHANWSWWRTPWKKNQRNTFSKAGKSLRRTPRALQTSWN